MEREKLVSLMRPTTHSDLDERTAEQVLKLIAERDRYRADRDDWREQWGRMRDLASGYRAALEDIDIGSGEAYAETEHGAFLAIHNVAKRALKGEA